MEITMKDCIIIGAGPAGLTAGIYGVRAGLDLQIIEKFAPGGQVMNTFEVENYPGFVEPIAGWELMSAMEGQAKRLGVEVTNGDIESVEKIGEYFEVKLTDGTVVESKTVVAASGASLRKLGVPGEAEFMGKGVSYCATCDGAFFKDKVCAVIGGGDTALEEAYFLTRFASKVYIVHRRDEFRAVKAVEDRVMAEEIVEPVYDSVVSTINGDTKINSITVKNVKDNTEKNIDVDGVFIFIGYDANTQYLPKEITNDWGEIIVDMHMKTAIEGLYAAGDMRKDSLRQIVTACADGATAVMGAYEYIISLKK